MGGELFPPEVPFVVGFLLEQRTCRAVLHALPVCQIEQGRFVPRFSMFLMTYFSETPEAAYRELVAFASRSSGAEGYAGDFRLPPAGNDSWWNLRPWVEAGSLFWVEAHDPDLGLRTQASDAFPYGEISGRRTCEFI